jgi:hypothetical protein
LRVLKVDGLHRNPIVTIKEDPVAAALNDNAPRLHLRLEFCVIPRADLRPGESRTNRDGVVAAGRQTLQHKTVCFDPPAERWQINLVLQHYDSHSLLFVYAGVPKRRQTLLDGDQR